MFLLPDGGSTLPAHQTIADHDAASMGELRELGRQEVVHYRVEAAAEAGEAERDGMELSDGFPQGAVCDDVLASHQVEEEVDVVGGEAQQEDEHAHEHHAESLTLVAVLLEH